MKVSLEVTASGLIEVDLDEDQLEDVQGQLVGGPAELETFVSKNAIEVTNNDLCDFLCFKVVSAQIASEDPETSENESK